VKQFPTERREMIFCAIHMTENWPLFSRERSSTGSNDCFVVVLVLVVVGIFIL
jgi:hypothetical protein